ncbi:MAG: ABC transporter [Desulfobulbus propionicus]|nr:MAG: ABC transporter [Desulfobulbus propionicus]
MVSVLSFSLVSKIFPGEVGKKDQHALTDLSFQLGQGETLGLIGANGAGKSTTIKLLMDFLRPSSGEIQLFDSSPTAPLLRQKIGYLPEVANFPPNLTVCDVLRFTAQSCGLAKDILQQRSRELLAALDLWEARKQPVRNYSKGMQQRANFAVALLNDPELLVLDEPMSGLDPMGRKKIIDLIGQLKEAGKTILFCSHILEDVDRLVDNILLLHKGKKLFFGVPAALMTQEEETTLAEAFVHRIKREETHG